MSTVGRTPPHLSQRSPLSAWLEDLSSSSHLLFSHDLEAIDNSVPFLAPPPLTSTYQPWLPPLSLLPGLAQEGKESSWHSLQAAGLREWVCETGLQRSGDGAIFHPVLLNPRGHREELQTSEASLGAGS